MTTLHIALDDAVKPGVSTSGLYARHLAAALVETAPTDCSVDAVVSSSVDDDELRAFVPGLTDIHHGALRRREQRAAWAGGMSLPKVSGLLHSPSLFAPLKSADRAHPELGLQQVVTVHDRRPRAVDGATARLAQAWWTGMIRRAERLADAVVVPTHALAEELTSSTALGSRLRVIPSAPAPAGVLDPDDPRLAALPERYLAASVTLDHRDDLPTLLGAAVESALPLVLLVDAQHGSVDLPLALSQAHVPAQHVTVIDETDAALRRSVLQRAELVVHAPAHDSDAALLLEAFQAGAAVLARPLPSIREISEGAARMTEEGADLAEQISALLDDTAGRERLRLLAEDRVRAYTWQGTAAKVWELHADL